MLGNRFLEKSRDLLGGNSQPAGTGRYKLPLTDHTVDGRILHHPTVRKKIWIHGPFQWSIRIWSFNSPICVKKVVVGLHFRDVNSIVAIYNIHPSELHSSMWVVEICYRYFQAPNPHFWIWFSPQSDHEKKTGILHVSKKTYVFSPQNTCFLEQIPRPSAQKQKKHIWSSWNSKQQLFNGCLVKQPFSM